MVSVSRETESEIEQRLTRVLRQAEVRVLPGVWSYVESDLGQVPVLDDGMLAVIRDETSWSVLRAAPDHTGAHERFGVFSFHFPDDIDNSGFVGWLATALKRELGTGVFVVCGSNSARGGIYDYWGCPIELLPEALDVLDRLAASPRPSTSEASASSESLSAEQGESHR